LLFQNKLLSLQDVKQVKTYTMNKIEFIIGENEVIESLVNKTNVSDEEVTGLVRAFIDLGEIPTEKRTEGSIEYDSEKCTVKCTLTEFDGEVTEYEDSVVQDWISLETITNNEPVEQKKIGFKCMSNLG